MRVRARPWPISFWPMWLWRGLAAKMVRMKTGNPRQRNVSTCRYPVFASVQFHTYWSLHTFLMPFMHRCIRLLLACSGQTLFLTCKIQKSLNYTLHYSFSADVVADGSAIHLLRKTKPKACGLNVERWTMTSNHFDSSTMASRCGWQRRNRKVWRDPLRLTMDKKV